MSADDPRSRAVAAVAAVRADLLARFGWTDLAVDLAVTDARIELRGEVVAPRVRARIRAAVEAAVPGLAIDERLALRRGASWHALPAGVTPLWRRPDERRELATELLPDDGPVERLASIGAATLVRAPDGTLGWTDAMLGAASDPPRLGGVGPFDRSPLRAVPATWADVPYRLGGTTRQGVDCSGLVQRTMGEIGVRLPRHSGDQLAVAPREGEGPDDLGTLVFLWADDEAPGHVALALGDGRLVHASRSRSRVVVDVRADLLARGRRVAHVAWADLEALQRRAIGHTSLVEVVPLGEITARS